MMEGKHMMPGGQMMSDKAMAKKKKKMVSKKNYSNDAIKMARKMYG